MENYIVAALYKFVSLPHFKQLQQPLLSQCQSLEIKGTLLLAEEGINGTIAGSRESIDSILQYLRNMPEFADLEHKESSAAKMPFIRMKVKLKNEIVTLGVPGIDPTKSVGTYLNPKQWNELISDPNTINIDTRNDYEVNIGKFKNAINPNTTSFREFPDYVKNNLDPQKHTKIAMYCTGGIRCEKSTAYMLSLGFKEVYHLKGGILKYLEETPQDQSLWDGQCFVFDERISVGHGLIQGPYDQCHGCRHPITQDDKLSPKYQKGVSCPRCYDNVPEEKKQRSAQRQLQIDLAKQRGSQHLGSNPKKHRESKLTPHPLVAPS